MSTAVNNTFQLLPLKNFHQPSAGHFFASFLSMDFFQVKLWPWKTQIANFVDAGGPGEDAFGTRQPNSVVRCCGGDVFLLEKMMETLLMIFLDMDGHGNMAIFLIVIVICI